MEKNYRQALTEVLEVLNHTDKKLIERIPKDFAIFLLKNQDKQYKPQIDFSLDNWETFLKNEAQALLAYIYKEYLTTEQEKVSLLKDEELVQKGEEMLKKYGSEDLFNNVSNENDTTSQNTPVEVKSSPWYKKVFQKFINLFK